MISVNLLFQLNIGETKSDNKHQDCNRKHRHRYKWPFLGPRLNMAFKVVSPRWRDGLQGNLTFCLVWKQTLGACKRDRDNNTKHPCMLQQTLKGTLMATWYLNVVKNTIVKHYCETLWYTGTYHGSTQIAIVYAYKHPREHFAWWNDFHLPEKPCHVKGVFNSYNTIWG